MLKITENGVEKWIDITQFKSTKIFEDNNLGTYEQPKKVLFTGSVETACGGASSASTVRT